MFSIFTYFSVFVPPSVFLACFPSLLGEKYTNLSAFSDFFISNAMLIVSVSNLNSLQQFDCWCAQQSECKDAIWMKMELEKNDFVTFVFMVLFQNQRLLLWSEEFEGQF